MSSRGLRNQLGLPYGPLHDEPLEGKSITVSAAVSDFIESEDEAKRIQVRDIARLQRRQHGLQPAHRLSRCQHRKADGGLSSCFCCASSYRKWVIPQAIALCRYPVEATIVTVLIKELSVGDLQPIDLIRERDALRKRLSRAGFTTCIGNLELAFAPMRHTWVLHAHLLVFGPCIIACERLKAMISLPRAVQAEAVRTHRRVRRISYIFKFTTCYRHPSSPRLLPLPEDQLVELVCWRMRYRLLDHLILLGMQRRGVIVPGPAYEQMLASPPGFGDVDTLLSSHRRRQARSLED